MNRIILQSMLSFNDIYHYKKTSNILLYNSKNINLTIPCTCSCTQIDNKLFITFKCRTFLTTGLLNYIKSSEIPIYINGIRFYVGYDLTNNCEMGEPAICEFDLITKDSLIVEG